MKIGRKTRARMDGEIKAKSENCIRLLLEGKLEEAKNHWEYIRFCEEIAPSYENKRKFVWAVMIGFFCISLVGLAFSLRVNTTPISMEVLVDGLTLNLDRGWKGETPLFADDHSINNLRHVSSSLDPNLRASDIPFSMSLHGARIKLASLSLDSEAEVSFEAQKEQLRVYAKNTQITGSFYVEKGQVRIEGLESLSDPHSFFYFTSNRVGPHSSPVTLTLKNRVSWDFFGLNPNKLEFKTENPPGSGNFESLIREGKVLLLDTNKDIELRKNETIHVVIKNTTRFVLGEKDNKINVLFEGRISKLVGGPGGRPRNLKPTYLEYLYGSQKVALLWGSFVFIFGLLWSIKNTIFK